MGTSRYGRATADLDLFTDAYRITGRALVGAGGFQAELESSSSSYLEMEDVYISRINQPGEIVASYPTAVFRKDNINFIMVQEKRSGSGAGGAQFGRPLFTRGRPVAVFLTVPSFEIRGEVQQEGKVVLRELLAKSLGQFQPLQAAQASASLYPDISYSSDLLFVHKERIGIFCLAG
ncbi:MAG: hypothetical protein H6668_07600 [Ardenticatenaceae bacterium]|nr:hypothetical protein [Ardenticatenaceae bacterium]